MVHPGAIEWLKIFEGSNGISNVAESEFDGSVQAAFATRLTSTSCMIKFVSRFSLQAGIYIAGAFAGNFLNGTAFARTAQSSGDMFVAKMNTAGTWCPWCTWCHCGCMRAEEGVLVLCAVKFIDDGTGILLSHMSSGTIEWVYSRAANNSFVTVDMLSVLSTNEIIASCRLPDGIHILVLNSTGE